MGRKSRRVLLRCETCGVEFLGRLATPSRKQRRFCGKKCHHASQCIPVVKNCLVCKKPFLTDGENRKNTTCSAKCRYELVLPKITGRIRTTDLSRRLSDLHPSVRWYAVRSPENIVYEILNTCRFVEEHKHLFLKEDTVWKKQGARRSLYCRASKGLSQLRVRPYGWKGWTLQCKEKTVAQ